MMFQWTYVYAVVAVLLGSFMISDAIGPSISYPSTIANQGPRVLRKDEINQLNDYMINYLFYIEKLTQTAVNDYIKKTMHAVKLLIVQSWVSTLEPDIGHLTIPRKMSLNQFKDNIISSIKNIEHGILKDYILYYVTKLEPQIRNELESEKNSLKYAEKIFYEEEKVFLENHDKDTVSLIASYQTTWNDILDVLNEIRSNVIIHKISTRMILQSYIAIFIDGSEHLGDKFTLTSDDGSDSEEFFTPDSGHGIYKDIVDISKEVDKDIMGSDKVKYEVYYDILNERIKNYLQTFDEVKDNTQLGRPMTVVKLLMTQGWIDILTPGPMFIPLENDQTLETKRNEILTKLTETIGISQVKEAILQYTDGKEEQIERDFKTNYDSLTEKYKLKHTAFEKSKENKEENNRIKEELKELERKINIQNDNLIAHKICKLFYLNSYRQDFLSEQQNNVEFNIETSRGKARRFTAPPVVVKNFFKDYISMDL